MHNARDSLQTFSGERVVDFSAWLVRPAIQRVAEELHLLATDHQYMDKNDCVKPQRGQSTRLFILHTQAAGRRMYLMRWSSCLASSIAASCSSSDVSVPGSARSSSSASAYLCFTATAYKHRRMYK